MLSQLAFHGVVTGIGIEQIPGQTGIQPQGGKGIIHL